MVDVHADYVPTFLRGGSVLPKRERPRRSSQGSHTDPFTLVVAPAHGLASASGTLFVDAYDGYEATTLKVRFELEAGGRVLHGSVEQVGKAGPSAAAGSMIERIVFWGQVAAPREVLVRKADGQAITGVLASYDASAGAVTVRQPMVSIGEAWTVELVP